MKKYELLEHKADFKIRVFGKTKKELFLNAMLGMIERLRPKIGNSKIRPRNLKIKSPNLETLLVDFLNEILYLNQVKKEVYNNIKFLKLTEIELVVKLFGLKTEKFGEEIKAVTYHGLEIKKGKGGKWEAVVLFDI